MKCLSVIFISMALAMVYETNAKPFVSIGADIPIPMPPGIPEIPRIPSGIPSRIPSGIPSASNPEEADSSKEESSKETETMEKSESVFYGYYPYYYGYPHYGYHYPYVVIGK